jgi:hypothetical protein
MEAREIKVGDVVTKGMHDFTVVSLPVNDIFRAMNDKGETVVMSAPEVTKWPSKQAD